jgi:hypothetical protein
MIELGCQKFERVKTGLHSNNTDFIENRRIPGIIV